MKLIALNLPRDFDEQNLEELFKVHGNVSACNLVLDDKSGASKGFGFVEMELEEEAMVAIEKLHGTKVNKNKIRVKPAK
ncbi:MAG: RNA-binding protein [Rhodospirillaceae bacterium]|jgi:RNA recognition motif-containing protein|nr:RNA-binding protein [Rhodospirillaceae bacterium]MBT5245302.1 RNA-binding protein [Rhodospirillaceae bacterium]MBT5561418.1 RNA-binding protein [Rhodospirillaceae bacterium]MBT6243329.1 RNA-binding protein [Rhodospirillaceae bacterium]MBT7137168.1 RNA-binding protein [Rhodospirillaceae bacterium]